jgi:hypothetical protein
MHSMLHYLYLCYDSLALPLEVYLKIVSNLHEDITDVFIMHVPHNFNIEKLKDSLHTQYNNLLGALLAVQLKLYVNHSKLTLNEPLHIDDTVSNSLLSDGINSSSNPILVKIPQAAVSASNVSNAGMNVYIFCIS